MALDHRFEDDSVSRVLDLLGERWTILLIREAFFGVHRFSDFARNLGITNRNLLATRLRALVEAGVFERHDQGPGRVDYRLTARGRELYQPIVALMAWGDRYLAGPEGPPLTLQHRRCGHEFTPVTVCDHCGTPLDPREVDAHPGPGYRPRTSCGVAPAR